MGSLNKLMDFLKKIIKEHDKKKVMQNAVIAIVIGIIILIAASTLFSGGKKSEASGVDGQGIGVEAVSKRISPDDNTELVKEIERILSEIEGAGKVSVVITYTSGKELVPATDIKRNENDTSERANDGGTREINQNDYESKVAYEESQGGTKKPIVIKELLPQVKGVVVVADGANNPTVKENLNRAVQVLVDIPIHKIQVFKREK